MSSSPATLQWMTAFVLLARVSWVRGAVGGEVVPTPVLNTDNPQNRVWGIVLLVVIGLLSYSFASEVLGWVWMGIRHLLGLDLEGL